MVKHYEPPNIEDFLQAIRSMVELPTDDHYRQAYDLMRMNSFNIYAATDVVDLIGAFIAFGDDPPTPLALTLWKGMLIIAGLVATRYVTHEPYLRSHLNIIYLLLGSIVDSDSDRVNALRYFSKVSLMSDASDTVWLAANIEVRFSLTGTEGYDIEIQIARQLAETARTYHQHLYLQACLLIGYISTEYGYYRDSFIYGQQALVTAYALGLTHYERSAIVYMSDFAIGRPDQILIDQIIQYWNDIRPAGGDTDHQDAVWYSSIWRKYYYAGQYEIAEECTRLAYEVFKSRQYHLSISKTQASLAMVLVKQGRYNEAIEHSHQAFLTAHHHHYPIPAVNARHIEGWAMLKDHAFDDALNTLILSLSMALQLESSNIKRKFLVSIMGDLASALDSIPPPQQDNQTQAFVIGLIPIVFDAIHAIDAQNLEAAILKESN